MKCSEIQRYCMENAGEEMSAECLQHLVACEKCRRVYERALSLCKLISLKQYEKPDFNFDDRCFEAIQRRIDEHESRPQIWGARLWEWYDQLPVPALRYTMAAAVVALMAVHVVTIQNLPSLESDFVASMEAPDSPSNVDQFIAASTNPITPSFADQRPVMEIASPPDQMFQIASNGDHRGVQYGPGPSRLVGFEY